VVVDVGAEAHAARAQVERPDRPHLFQFRQDGVDGAQRHGRYLAHGPHVECLRGGVVGLGLLQEAEDQVPLRRDAPAGRLEALPQVTGGDHTDGLHLTTIVSQFYCSVVKN